MSFHRSGLVAPAFLLGALLLPTEALAGPTVVVEPFHGDRAVAASVLGAVAEDVRAALLAAVTARGGTVLTTGAMDAVARPAQGGAAGGCSTRALCDLAHARALGADLLVSGEASILDGATSLSLQVVGTKSGNLLAARRVQGNTTAELLRESSAAAAQALDEVFERHGPPRVQAGAPAAYAAPAAPAASTPLPDADSVVHAQGANLFRGVEAVGGRVTVTRRHVRFEAHALNVQGGAESFAIADVVGMERVPTLLVNNGVVVRLRDGREKRFVLEDRERFIRAIEENRPGG